MEQHPIILFDGVCNLCSGFARFVIAHDREARFRFAAMQSPAGRALLERYGLPLEDWESNVLIEAGTAYLKSTACLRIVRRLAFPWRLLYAVRLVPRPLRDWLYDRIARNRYAIFGRQTRCMLPEEGTQERFLGSG
jgi:predicted DCC family thiol-disulfide oxidoreductase YuxK